MIALATVSMRTWTVDAWVPCSCNLIYLHRRYLQGCHGADIVRLIIFVHFSGFNGEPEPAAVHDRPVHAQGHGRRRQERVDPQAGRCPD